MSDNLIVDPTFAADGSWEKWAPRDEVAPDFARDAKGGRLRKPALRLSGRYEADCGAWTGRAEGIEGGGWYEATVRFVTEGVGHVHDSVFAKVGWHDEKGKLVEKAFVPIGPPRPGWRQARALLQAPPEARSATMELGLKWAPGGTVWWCEPSLVLAEVPPERRIRVAAVCWQPEGGSTPDRNRELFAQKAAEAGEKGADICLLGEAIALVGTGATNEDVAEPVPGPSTEALGRVAKQHGMWIVAGIYERVGRTIYNTAVLLNRQGELAGTYHKTHLPESEVLGGLTPGDEYPVFATDFGVIGMQICYDHFFSEVTQSLALNGAEMVFTPIWGDEREDGYCWDIVARARAIDNSIWYVAAKYSGRRSLIVDPWGHIRGDTAGEFGIALADLDLNERRLCPWLSVRGRGEWANLHPNERRPHTYTTLTTE